MKRARRLQNSICLAYHIFDRGGNKSHEKLREHAKLKADNHVCQFEAGGFCRPGLPNKAFRAAQLSGIAYLGARGRIKTELFG